MTAAPVRWSAWLGVAVIGRNGPATTGQKHESELRTRVSEAWNRRLVEAGEATESEKLGLAETVERCKRQTGLLGENMKRRKAKTCVSGAGSDSGQTLNEA